MDEEKVNETILIQGNDTDEDPKPQSDSGPDGGSSFGTKYTMILYGIISSVLKSLELLQVEYLLEYL